MAFRDRFDKLISYIGIDDGEEEDVLLGAQEPEIDAQATTVAEPVSTPAPNRPTAPKTKPIHQRPVAPSQHPEPLRTEDTDSHTFSIFRDERARADAPRLPERPQAPTSRPNQSTVRSQAQESQVAQSGQTQIAIKHPLRYEDATAIADAFLLGQCILVDFEYMQDAQARRCIDFLTGACLVAQGTLQKVSATMFLLTPKGVVVTMEDVLPQQRSQEATYDFDMKRR